MDFTLHARGMFDRDKPVMHRRPLRARSHLRCAACSVAPAGYLLCTLSQQSRQGSGRSAAPHLCEVILSLSLPGPVGLTSRLVSGSMRNGRGCHGVAEQRAPRQSMHNSPMMSPSSRANRIRIYRRCQCCVSCSLRMLCALVRAAWRAIRGAKHSAFPSIKYRSLDFSRSGIGLQLLHAHDTSFASAELFSIVSVPYCLPLYV